mmetsp:Transcript_6432/g.9590  ORF Transcript_6432/g.9590 Transcript_6432/m.9590 type:complete len:147 (+) Transcript_6432:21-461(+)
MEEQFNIILGKLKQIKSYYESANLLFDKAEEHARTIKRNQAQKRGIHATNNFIDLPSTRASVAEKDRERRRAWGLDQRDDLPSTRNSSSRNNNDRSGIVLPPPDKRGSSSASRTITPGSSSSRKRPPMLSSNSSPYDRTDRRREAK